MEWSIQARSHQCQTCGRGFRNKETLHTLLRDERNVYVRVDVCEACWTAHYAEGANHQRGFVSCWRSHYSTPLPPPPEPIRKETAETLLRRLVERNAPEHAAACFILAVMLERKRLLKVKSEATDGERRLLIYEHPKSGDVFTIPDPHLRLDQLEAVQRDVARLLEHGLEAPPASAAESSRGERGASATPSGPADGSGSDTPGGVSAGAAGDTADAEAAPEVCAQDGCGVGPVASDLKREVPSDSIPLAPGEPGCCPAPSKHASSMEDGAQRYG